jgi:hypothetical protein
MGRAANTQPSSVSGTSDADRREATTSARAEAGFAAVFGSAHRGTGGVPDRETERPGREAWWMKKLDRALDGATRLAAMVDTCACRGLGLIRLEREDAGYRVLATGPRNPKLTPATLEWNPLPVSYSDWVISPELAGVLVEAWPKDLIEDLELDEAGEHLAKFRGRLQAEGREYGRSAPRRISGGVPQSQS